MMLILLVLILIVTIFLGVLVFKRTKEIKPDYKTLYIIGISWFPLGIIFMASGLSVGVVFSIMGLCFLAVGLMNKDKWKDAKPMTAKQKKYSIILLILGLIVFLITLAAYFVRFFNT